MYFFKTTLLSLLLLNTCLAFAESGDHQAVLKQLHLPEGFKISIYADNVPNARSLALGDNGVVFVGTGAKGSVYALQDSNNDGIAEQHHVIASNLRMPNGVAFKDSALYVAEINRIIRFDGITKQLTKPPKPVVIYDQFPSDKHHGWKYLRFGPDNKLYTAIGAPCNICNPEKDIYASLVRLNPDGSDFEIIAKGIRNTVGFDWQPETGTLFFNDNGRDLLGEDTPPDELNQWSVKGDHFGYPYCHGGNIPDPELAADKKCSQFTAPVWKFKAHIAPLGLRFYQGTQFPVEYKNQLFVAQHGSWNRTEPQGYRVDLIRFNKGKPVSEQDFISGWLTKEGNVLGRPVDMLTLPDGSLLISDDKLGVIYKVEYQGK
ncbi:PQQ-dependent sugar dehydrogenase [Methylobacter psychrophilus]|uniref:PQQ-dependent sugar dehydrogenase n=1 Tax=Methylobacter psychrophilus TaxID=96941 RepID=UPI0021D4FEB2|nr:PQQ-dependent sugar dehydrogenase [Methylobacter psychrophilus]